MKPNFSQQLNSFGTAQLPVCDPTRAQVEAFACRKQRGEPGQVLAEGIGPEGGGGKRGGTTGTSLLITCYEGPTPPQPCTPVVRDSDLSPGANNSQHSID